MKYKNLKKKKNVFTPVFLRQCTKQKETYKIVNKRLKTTMFIRHEWTDKSFSSNEIHQTLVSDCNDVQNYLLKFVFIY